MLCWYLEAGPAAALGSTKHSDSLWGGLQPEWLDRGAPLLCKQLQVGDMLLSFGA